MKIKTKLLLNGLAAVSSIIAIAGIGASSMSKSQKSFETFSYWSDVDMVMNEAVTQQALKFSMQIEVFRRTMNSEEYKRSLTRIKELKAGLAEWKESFGENKDLDSVVTASTTNIEKLRALLERSQKNISLRKETVTKIDTDVKDLLALLLKTMEETIDPAKGKFEEAKNIDGMVKWGAIDMLMNEAVIAHSLKLQTTFHDYFHTGENTSYAHIENSLKVCQSGLSEWRETCTGETAMLAVCDRVKSVYDKLDGLKKELKAAFDDEGKAAQELMAGVSTLLDDLNTAMETVIDPAKETAIGVAEKQRITSLYISTAVVIFVSLITIIIVGSVSKSIIRSFSLVTEFSKKLSKGDLSERLPMGDSVTCYESRNCSKTDCPSFGKRDNCWVTCGSFNVNPTCEKALAGQNCEECEVYKSAVHDEIDVMGSALNAMADAQMSKAEAAKMIADGDLTVEMTIASDVDILGQSLSEMVNGLKTMLYGVNSTTLQVASGSHQVSSASNSLSEGAVRQAAALEQITSSISEVENQSKSCAENAEEASSLTQEAKAAAEKGNETMRDMVKAMNDINDSSQKIEKIIKVIDDIAFQTNLLALNAAVEAARAGQHGKGFAVVAEEVRSLAGRSAKAAHETSELIEDSGRKVTSGSLTAERTAEELDTISQIISKATDLVNEIATASKEQQSGVSQISSGLREIDSVTQQNAANAEETSAAAQTLATQGEELSKLISKFNLNDSSNSAMREPQINRSLPPTHE